MKRNKNRIPKKLLMQLLQVWGLTLARETFMGRRMWVLSNGKRFDSLHAIFGKYRHSNDKNVQFKLDPIVEKIKLAIF